MKLTRNTEWAVIAVLIVYNSFTSGFRFMKDIMATPLGKAAVLAVIIYVWKFVSCPIALLLTISFMRCAKWTTWELFSGAEQSCTCETSGAIWDSQSKTCKDASGNTAGPVKTCTCSNGYAWDGGEKGKKECIPVTSAQPPVPPTENPVAAALDAETAAAKEAEAKIVPTPPEAPPAAEGAAGAAGAAATTTESFMGSSLWSSAPATDGRKGPSEVPQTTGSAGAALLRDSFVPSRGYGGVQPVGGGMSSVPALA
jgi:hypothetical protein